MASYIKYIYLVCTQWNYYVWYPNLFDLWKDILQCEHLCRPHKKPSWCFFSWVWKLSNVKILSFMLHKENSTAADQPINSNTNDKEKRN